MSKVRKLGLGVFLMMLLTSILTVPSSAYTYLPESVMENIEVALPYAIVPVVTLGLIICILHASYLIGWQNALKFFGYGYIIAYIFEEISVHTGLIFGLYYFPPMMGPKLDVIPLVVPMFWLMCFYTAWYITNLILDGSPVPTNWSTARIIAGAFIGGGILTTLDLSADPFATANGFWIWPNGGTFFHEPVHNFVGWWLTGAFTLIVHGLILRKDTDDGPLVLETKGRRIWSVAMVVVYSCMALGFTALNVHQSLGVPTSMAMGIPALIAIWKWINWYKETDAVPEEYRLPANYSYVFDPEFEGKEEEAE